MITTPQRADRRIVLGIGSGRCGTRSLATLLNQQPDAHVTHEDRPFLPWTAADPGVLISRRLKRMQSRDAGVIGDVAPFYLPYLEHVFKLVPNVRIIGLQRPREEVVESFCAWLDRVHPLPTNHWARAPEQGWFHCPMYSRTFPKYDLQDRAECIGRYWDEYYDRVNELAERHPENLRLFETEASLNSESGVQDLLSFAGISEDQQVRQVGVHEHRREAGRCRRRDVVDSGDRDDPRRCVILVPYQTHIVPACEESLKELERRGYEVRRVPGYASIDQGRCQMGSDALLDGFEETLWIDSDVGFEADSVERIRSHHLPIVAGLYPKKGKREIACHIFPGTKQVVFGEGGGLYEILYAPTGFLHVRREVYMSMLEQLDLPVCNEQFKRPMFPHFAPLIRTHDEGHWYLADDYAFCHRARQCGYRILADTTLRLWHVGMYPYGWEDAGIDRQRFSTFRFNFGSDIGGERFTETKDQAMPSAQTS